MAARRLFVATDPSPAVRERLAAAVERVRPSTPRARWVNTASLHVTLAFLGDTAEESIAPITAALGEAARAHAPIAARFAGAGAFGGRRPRVLWVGLTEGGDALAALHRDVAAALAPFGYVPEHDLTPHVTLARAGDRAGDPALAACATALAGEDFGETRIEAVVLYQSDLSPKGARYTALATLPLGGG